MPYLQGEIARARSAVDAAPQSEPARRLLADLQALSAELDRMHLNRVTLEPAAASLGRILDGLRRDLNDALARARRAETLRDTSERTRVARTGEQARVRETLATARANLEQRHNTWVTTENRRREAEAELARLDAEIRDHMGKRPIRPPGPIRSASSQRAMMRDDNRDPGGGSELPRAWEIWQAKIEAWQERLPALRQQQEAAATRLTQLAQEASPLAQQRDVAQAAVNVLAQQNESLQEEISELVAAIAAATRDAGVAGAEANVLRPRVAEVQLARETATARLLGMITTDQPIVLLPVRLETQFGTGARGPELWLRVYPDSLHVDTHEPELTDEEERWGRHFREQIVAAGADEADKQLAWAQLAERFGARRAAWIARAIDAVGTGPVAKRAQTWTRAPRTDVLPDRWVVIGYRGTSTVLTAWGGPIGPEPLSVGPVPLPNADPLATDSGMRWMLDFDAAVQAGMGLRIPLSADDARLGFDRLIVLGAKASQGPTESARRLGSLLDAHHHTDGLAFVPQGTPTNNTRDRASGLDFTDADANETYRVERSTPLTQATVAVSPDLRLDAARLVDGELAAFALGLSPQVFEHVSGANGEEQREARAMHLALWSASSAPFLSRHQALPPDPTAISAIRRHALEYTRARGPLPTLRLGSQPYGLLPATSLERWAPTSPAGSPPAPDATTETALVAQLRRLFSHWLDLGARAPRMGRGGDLASLLAQQAVSCNYAVRRFGGGAAAGEPLLLTHPRVQVGDGAEDALLDPNYLTLLATSQLDVVRNHTYPGWRPAAAIPLPLLYLLLQYAVRRALDPALGAVAQERAEVPLALGYLGRRAADTSNPLTPAALGRLLAEGLDLGSYRLDAWIASVATRRLDWLRRRVPSGVRLGGYGYVEDLRPREVALRSGSAGYVHAPSLGHAATAAVLRSGYLAHQQAGQGNPFAVDLSSERVRRAQWLLDGVRQGQSLGALLGYRFERALQDAGLAHYVAPFRTLAAVRGEGELAKRTTEIEQLRKSLEAHDAMVGAAQAQSNAAEDRLGAARLDREQMEAVGRSKAAGMTVFNDAEERLRQASAAVQRAQQAIDNQGARPQSDLADSPDLDARNKPIRTLRLATSTDIGSWVTRMFELRVELMRAITARNEAQAAWDQMQPARDALQRELAAIEKDVATLLAAERARTTEANGAATVLEGRRSERNRTAVSLDDARKGLVSLLVRQWQTARESITASNVVNGMELYRRWRSGNATIPPIWDGITIPFNIPGLGLPAPSHPEHARVVAQLRALEEAVDAVGDAVIAESMYQLIQGNPLRSGATLAGIASGEAPPPELEVARTPRSGRGVTHRLLALLPAGAAAPATWGTSATRPRAQAQPALNAWLARLLGNPATVRCLVELRHPETDAVLHKVELTLASLGLSPLDVVLIEASRDEAQRSELEQRVAYFALRTRPATVPPDARVVLSFRRNASWPLTVVSVGEFIETSRSLRALVVNARGIDARDLAMPNTAPASGVDLADLERRADAAVAALDRALLGLRRALVPFASGPGTLPNLDALRGALIALADFGIQGAVPLVPAGDTTEARRLLVPQGRSVEQEATRRLKLATSALTSTTPDARRAHHVERLRAVFGQEFPVLLTVQVEAEHAEMLRQTFADTRRLAGQDPLEVAGWVQRYAQVREGVGRLDAALAMAEALDIATVPSLRVGQLPHRPVDRWVALPATSQQPIEAGRVSLVALAQDDLQFGQPLAGLLVDEWVEIVPSQTEVTGLTFHFDQPNARPPQAVLLAVPPDVRPERGLNAWDLDTLDAIVRETFDLARARAVLPEESIWVEDDIPIGATLGAHRDTWRWGEVDPEPFGGQRVHHSDPLDGLHQHYFENAADQLRVDPGDRLFAYVYVDPDRPPREVMLQWRTTDWLHRAYWGENLIEYGTDNTTTRYPMGPLPLPGGWVRLEVPANLVGLEGQQVNGMAFTLYDGHAAWDRAGKTPGSFYPMEGGSLIPGLWFVDGPDFRRAAGAAGTPPTTESASGLVPRGTRLEPRVSATDISEGLAATVHDPLWLLARQWQFSELLADDAGSPAQVDVEGESARLTRYRLGPQQGATTETYPHAVPLEVLVEREAIGPSTDRTLRQAAEAGRRFLSLLTAAGAGAYRAAYRAAYAMPQPTPAERTDLDADTLGFRSVAAGRVVDGRRLFADLSSAFGPLGAATGPVPARPPIPDADRPKVEQAARAWLTWYAHQGYSQPLGEGPAAQKAWLPERMEYELAVAAQTSAGEVALTVPEYPGGHLDWTSFTVNRSVSLGAAPPTLTSLRGSYLPAPVSYRGMPASRFWEFEDGRVNFSRASSEAERPNPALLLLLEFALVYGNDWFMVPIEVMVGSLNRITALTVRDTFGGRISIPHARTVDGAGSPWQMFCLSTDPRVAGGGAPLDQLFIPPSLGPSLQGKPIEELLLVRDEMANMAWAVERVVESPIGRPINRREVLQARRGRDQDGATVGPPNGSEPLAYRLGSDVPENWIPFVEESAADIRAPRRLRRSALPNDAGGQTVPRGKLLEPRRSELFLFEEELPREGALIVRAYQAARWFDGSSHLWIGRRKRPGTGEGSSGLRFDVLEPRQAAEDQPLPPTLQVGVRSRIGVDTILRWLPE